MRDGSPTLWCPVLRLLDTPSIGCGLLFTLIWLCSDPPGPQGIPKEQSVIRSDAVTA